MDVGEGRNCEKEESDSLFAREGADPELTPAAEAVGDERWPQRRVRGRREKGGREDGDFRLRTASAELRADQGLGREDEGRDPRGPAKDKGRKKRRADVERTEVVRGRDGRNKVVDERTGNRAGISGPTSPAGVQHASPARRLGQGYSAGSRGGSQCNCQLSHAASGQRQDSKEN